MGAAVKWIVTVQDDGAKTITFEVEAQRLTWVERVAVFEFIGNSMPEFAIESRRLVKVENAGNAA